MHIMKSKKIAAYLITDRLYYTDTPAVFRSIVHDVFAGYLPEYALYRDKNNPNYALQAEHFLEMCAQFEGIKGLLHGDVELAHRLHAYGVHLTSQQFDQIVKAKEHGLYVIISTHTHEEAIKAEKLGADAVTYSPVFATPGKGKPKGLEDLKEIVGKIAINVFALGGITTPEQVEQVTRTGVYGFASIRYFLEKIKETNV